MCKSIVRFVAHVKVSSTMKCDVEPLAVFSREPCNLQCQVSALTMVCRCYHPLFIQRGAVKALDIYPRLLAYGRTIIRSTEWKRRFRTKGRQHGAHDNAVPVPSEDMGAVLAKVVVAWVRQCNVRTRTAA